MKINYRPEIDGLRAISVFAVIFYHADFFLFGHVIFQGGFIGVDIFFVISGYLITSLILKEINETNQFSFKNFYERRVRRILPVLFFALILSSIVAYFILTPLSLKDFGRAVISTIFFISNIYFWTTNTIYGNEDSLLKPLTHTWSLSVEEQFYILFPILLLILIRFFKKKFFLIIFSLFLLSLIFSEWSARTTLEFNYTMFGFFNLNFFANSNFFLILSRFFEFLIGSIISYLSSKLKRKKTIFKINKFYYILNKINPIFGIVLIFYSFIFFKLDKIFHPGLATLIPVLGTALIIGSFNKKGIITKILSNRLLVFLGIISYSLYIWHYLIFSFLRYLGIFNNSFEIKFLSILLTIILSIFSYYCIEKPFRNKKIISTKVLVYYVCITTVILISYCLYIFKTNGIDYRFPKIISESLSKKVTIHNKIDDKKKNIVLIGDSHASALHYYLNEELKKYYNFFLFDTVFYINDFNSVKAKNKNISKKFEENNKNIKNFLDTQKDTIIIWHQLWSPILDGIDYSYDYREKPAENYYEPVNFRITSEEERKKYLKEGLQLTVNNVLKNDNILILVYPVPEMLFHPIKSIERGLILNHLLNNNYKFTIPILTSDYYTYKKKNKITFEMLDSIQGSKIYRIYPEYLFCNTIIQNRCVTNNKEHLFYYDNSHLSLEGSKYVVNEIMKTIQQIKINEKN